MFNSIDEAIAFAKDKNDGGIPIFEHRAIEVVHSDPIAYEDYVHVTIINKGDPKSIIERPKRKEDEERWPAHWKAFVEGTEAPLEGTPLKEFPALSPAEIATCMRYHIRTVEDLADYPDVQLKNIGSRGTSLKQKAIAFLDYRSGNTDELLARIKELEKLVGNNTTDVPERGVGDGVSEPVDADIKQQPRRKNAPRARKKSSKKAG